MRLVILVGLIVLMSASPAFGDAVGNIQVAPSTHAALQFGQHVDITFDYEVATAGGVRIYPRPYSQGQLTPNYGASGSPLYPEGTGMGSGYFTITSSAALVDQIRFQIWTADNTTMLLEFYFPVSFYFSNHAIFNIDLTPSSPSGLKNNYDVDIVFDYGTNNPGDVHIWARPMTNGGLTPGYAASGSPAYPPGWGSGSGYFQITSGEVIVDQIRFQMKDATTNDLLLELFVPVTYDVQQAAVCNVTTMPASPVGWQLLENIEIYWSYAADEDVRIWARPYTNGSPTPSYGASGSPIYPAGTGPGSGTFTVTSGDVTVDEIYFHIMDAAMTETLAEFFVPCDIHFSGHPVIWFGLQQSSPAYYTLEHHADIDFTYYTSEPTGVRIWAIPWSNEPLTITALKWTMTDAAQTQLLMEWFTPVELQYGSSVPSGVAPSAFGGTAQAMFEKPQNPLREAASLRYVLPADGQVMLRLFDVGGRAVRTLVNEAQTAGAHMVAIPAQILDNGIYFARLDVADQAGQQVLFDRERLVLIK
jgi:hypothetical protein